MAQRQRPARKGVGGDSRVHSRPGAAQPSPELDRQLAVCDGLVDNSIFLGGQIRDNNANWVTRLFTGPPKLLKKSPLTTQFTFSPKANWSDGTPVTCADWRATWQIWINPANNPASRSGTRTSSP